MSMTSDSSKKRPADNPSAELEGIDRLFGRDVRSSGWVIDPRSAAAGGGRAGGADRSDKPPDPAMIWALRGRRR